MPVQPSYPGVYVEEVPSGVRSITGVATAVAAFVGRAQRGPTDVVGPVVVNSFGDFERVFGGLWQKSRLGFAVRDYFLNGGGQAVVVRLYHADSGAAARPDRAELTCRTLVLRARHPGQWGNRLRARVDHVTRPHDPAAGEKPDTLFNLLVRDDTTGVVEEFRNVAVAPADHPRRVDRVLELESNLVRATTLGPARPGADPDPPPGRTVWDDNTPPTNATVQTSGQASDGAALDDNDFVGPGKEAAKLGLYALEKADLFTLLAIPPYKRDSQGRDDQDVDTAVITAAAVYCERRRAFLLVDPPSKWRDKDAPKADLQAALGTNSRNAAVYFPRLRQPNPLNDNQIEDFAPSGAVAGVMARTDAQRGVWKAPAGTDATLVGVPDLSVPLTDGENGELNPLGVNCLRTMPVAGRVVWGARTLQGADRVASEWKYVPVRRLALFLEESLYRATQWVVFEPNDEPLWAQIRLNVGAFMNGLFRQGAFQGTSPREAYFVKCDKESTTQHDVDLGIVNIVVGFAPLKPAEFVVLRLQQLAGQVTT
ncbi:phage tail sheath subtilisin-like domain-containing protein [Streptomyces sp. NPDC001652]|uniref:phage tail sheath family protein n=1 Tax=Streptomyces sp. NPDC001652 TaxID=3154393 RepID=UPI00331F25E2